MCRLYIVANAKKNNSNRSKNNSSNRNSATRNTPSKKPNSTSSKNSRTVSNNRNPRQGWQPPKKSNVPLISSIVGGILIVIIIVVLIIVSSSSSSNQDTAITPAPKDIVTAITQVPLSQYNQIGTGGSLVSGLPSKIKSSPLVLNNKPEVLYMGDEWCPYCGAERWALILALSRFGTISNLYTAFSSGTDVYPNTPTFSLAKVNYSSPYISFVAVEMQTVNHTPLQNPTSQENSLLNKFGNGSIPFIDIGGKWYTSANYDPQVLQGLSHQSIAADLSLPNSQTAQAIIGSANYLTAAICSIDNDQPGSVCNSSGVLAAKNSLKITTKPSTNKNSSHIG